MADEREDPSRAELQAAAELLPALYAELRGLAAALTARLPPGQTLQPTALVHEAYLKMVRDRDPGWEGRRPGPCARSSSTRPAARPAASTAGTAGASS
jgi:ECF sigma factor